MGRKAKETCLERATMGAKRCDVVRHKQLRQNLRIHGRQVDSAGLADDINKNELIGVTIDADGEYVEIPIDR